MACKHARQGDVAWLVLHAGMLAWLVLHACMPCEVSASHLLHRVMASHLLPGVMACLVLPAIASVATHLICCMRWGMRLSQVSDAGQSSESSLYALHLYSPTV